MKESSVWPLLRQLPDACGERGHSHTPSPSGDEDGESEWEQGRSSASFFSPFIKSEDNHIRGRSESSREKWTEFELASFIHIWHKAGFRVKIIQTQDRSDSEIVCQVMINTGKEERWCKINRGKRFELCFFTDYFNCVWKRKSMKCYTKRGP